MPVGREGKETKGGGLALESPIIEARDLVKDYGNLRAVDTISFSIRPGEVFGFLGPNGAGKTSTMKMIQCVSPPTRGTLTVFGRDVVGHARTIKRWLGVVPQETNLDPDFTCIENLLVYARYFDIPAAEARQRAESLLAFMQLEEKADVPIDGLSGGMKRRLILARALVNNPRLLILDEPTIGLDPQARHLMWEKLKALQAMGNTILLTTHYLEEAERLCNRLVIMDRGKILVEGKPADLVRRYAGDEVVETESTPEVISCLEEMGCRYEVHGDMVQAFSGQPKVLAKRILDTCNPGRLFVRRGTLEDVFLSLTGRELRE
ncbi:MAG: ATP-binding cassette domain-containing protein [Methanolinea sp.]|nr:ATP-binding cassette domain-containing protein [Methanolinea sp.]